MRRKQQGVTLLELMLALAIATAVFILGIRLYAEYSFRLSESQLEANIEQFFQAMSHYYQANCRRQLDNNSNPQSVGTLDWEPANCRTSHWRFATSRVFG